jgi:hypothetical protein
MTLCMMLPSRMVLCGPPRQRGLAVSKFAQGSWTNFDNRNAPMKDPWPVAVAVNKDRAFVATWGSGVLEYKIAEAQWTSLRNDARREPFSRFAEATLDFATGVAYDSNSQSALDCNPQWPHSAR